MLIEFILKNYRKFLKKHFDFFEKICYNFNTINCHESVFGKVLNGNKRPKKCVIISLHYKHCHSTVYGVCRKEVCYEKSEIRLHLPNVVILSKT